MDNYPTGVLPLLTDINTVYNRILTPCALTRFRGFCLILTRTQACIGADVPPLELHHLIQSHWSYATIPGFHATDYENALRLFQHWLHLVFHLNEAWD